MHARVDSLHGLRVLVVEDETLIAEEIRERLTRLGLFVVDIADNSDQAIRLAVRHQPDLVLMDIRLKGSTDGIYAANEIRQKVQGPIVFLTAHSDETTLRRAKETGPFGYVLKPFQERDLVIAIEMALNRYRLEQRLRESEQRYAATLASIGDGVIATDRKGRVTFMNRVAEALTQWPLDDAQGMGIDAILPILEEKTRKPRENLAIEALRRNESVFLDEAVLMVTRRGELIPIDDSAAPISTEQGKIFGAVVAFRDIRQRRLTEGALRQAEDQLRHAQKMEAVGRLAGGVAHDFNNLLTVILASSELVLSRGPWDKMSEDLIREILKAGSRAAELTNQMLAFSRKQVLQPTALHLGELVKDISLMLRQLLGRDVVMKTRYPADLRLIWADAGQVELSIMNLAINARDAMAEGGEFSVDAQNVEVMPDFSARRPEVHPGQYVVLSVQDTGKGMDAITKERAFEPFFTTKEVGKGTGLGLATVYGIVRQSGGFIDFESSLGKGTTFKLYFPALMTSPTPVSTTQIQTTSSPGRETVLVVEDDTGVRSLVSTALRNHGYTVYEASDSEEALRVFHEYLDKIELVVSDVVLPGLSGGEIANLMYSIKPTIRVLFFSGYAADTVVRHGVLEGEAAFLQKPFTLSALAQKVREVLDRS